MTLEQLQEIQNQLRQWRADRHLSVESQLDNVTGNVSEELTELQRAKTYEEAIDALCDVIVFTMNSIQRDIKDVVLKCELENINTIYNPLIQLTKEFALTTSSKIIQMLLCVITVKEEYQDRELARVILEALGAIKELGYYPYIAMKETIREISSRTGKWDDKLGKFKKDAGVYGDKESLLEFEEKIKETYPDDNVVFDYRDNEVDVILDYGKEILTYKLWYKADYSKAEEIL